jgi:hypothetical protein
MSASVTEGHDDGDGYSGPPGQADVLDSAAQTLGLAIPPHVLLQATEVIQ